MWRSSVLKGTSTNYQAVILRTLELRLLGRFEEFETISWMDLSKGLICLYKENKPADSATFGSQMRLAPNLSTKQCCSSKAPTPACWQSTWQTGSPQTSASQASGACESAGQSHQTNKGPKLTGTWYKWNIHHQVKILFSNCHIYSSLLLQSDEVFSNQWANWASLT